MSETLATHGGITITKCFSKCNGCDRVAPAIQTTGPNGYVTICFECQMTVNQLLLAGITKPPTLDG